MEALKTYGWVAAIVSPFCLLIGGMVGQWLRSRTDMAKIKTEGDGALVGKLMARVDTLEAQVADLQKQLKAEQDRHDAEMQVTRHQSNNDRQVLDMMIYFLKANLDKFAADPDALRNHITEIEKMREQGRTLIAIEKGAQAGAKMRGVSE